VQRSGDVPAGAKGESMDFGTDVEMRHVVELPGDKQPFEGGLAGKRSFTIAGWIQVRAATEGDGGNRVVNYCGGGGGIDLVWVNSAGGQLRRGNFPFSLPFLVHMKNPYSFNKLQW
jgi:hypothetical protein